MKQKITYGLLTLLLLGGLYFGLRFMFGLFTPYNFWTAQQDIKNEEVRIIEIGELPLNFEQKQKLANSYGFNFSLHGCNVTTDILNGTDYYNRVVVDHLENKYGKGWWTKFQNQLDSIDRRTTRQITTEDIKGEWYLNKWTMYHTLSFADTTVFVDNHIDSVFTLLYSLSKDTLILHDNKSNITYKEKIITLTPDTLIIKSFGEHRNITGYSRTKREWTNE
ncbi:hypothetical protein [Pedobacter frigiditerrae]|uniref:FEKKY domain-containing protein n=1 Tax=Pedobacter frigiditerrae TaxID=2530452 RepID=UPI002931D94A|nr:hypothetical protein [Pedobacter frigiditerrae]